MAEKNFQYEPAADLGLPEIQRLKSARREPGLVSWLAHQGAAAGLNGFLRVYHRLAVRGRENLPAKPPFILVANHASHFDALVLAAALPPALRGVTFPIAAGDVFFETPPVAAFAAALVNALPLWRKKVGRHGLDDLKNRLGAGNCGYILFPEGARSKDGGPLPWKPGVGMMVAGTSIPVIPCRLFGCFESFPPGAVVPRPCRIGLKVGAPLSFHAVPDDREGWNSIAATLKGAVLSMEWDREGATKAP
jgi:1-acyl-sn-glycerol-3-phosphate acyltransferase